MTFCARLLSACSLTLLSCQGPDGTADTDRGPIEEMLADAGRASWPGLDKASGRAIPFLGAFGEGSPIGYWFLGFGSRRTVDSYWFCREDDPSCPLDEHRRINWPSLIGHPIFTRIPGDPAYSPFWQMWVVRVPDSFVPDSVKAVESMDELIRAGVIHAEPLVVDFGQIFGEEVGRKEVVAHCPLVLAGTELEQNGGPMRDGGGRMLLLPRRQGWFDGYRVELFDFSPSDGVFAAAQGSAERPLMRIANIYVLWRSCGPKPRAAICDLPGLRSTDRRPVSERGLGQDVTGDSDHDDTNNVVGSGPCALSRPTERPYSPLWSPLALVLPYGPEPGLVDTYRDDRRSDIQSVNEMFDFVSEQRLAAPTAMMEDETGNPVPGNDGQVLYNCPVPVREGSVPYPCEGDSP